MLTRCRCGESAVVESGCMEPGCMEPGCVAKVRNCGNVVHRAPCATRRSVPFPAALSRSTVSHIQYTTESGTMNILFVIVAIIAIVLLITGGFVQSLNFLLWVGVVLLILAVIAFLIRMISGRRSV